MTEWVQVFDRLVAHVRGCGWKCPVVLHGRRFVPIGMTSVFGRVHHNDNRKHG